MRQIVDGVFEVDIASFVHAHLVVVDAGVVLVDEILATDGPFSVPGFSAVHTPGAHRGPRLLPAGARRRRAVRRRRRRGRQTPAAPHAFA